MAEITDTPPEEVRAELAALRDVLDDEIPAKTVDRNLLIGTWNIRCFGGLTMKWRAESGDSPTRDLHALKCIGEIVSRFDVVAIQEAKKDLRALRHMLEDLGPEWGVILTDVTRGDPGNGERMAFVFDTRRVKPSGLACELVVPREQLEEIDPDALQEQFARTPYAVSFLAGDKTFILVTLHVLYGEGSSDRLPELRAIAEWLADWARDVKSYGHNLIALGDFNIDREGDELYEAFTGTGLSVPTDLRHVPRTLFSDPEKPNLEKYYDQIAWFEGAGATPALSLDYRRAGGFDFKGHTLQSRGLTKRKLSWRISDHYPLWAEFGIRGDT